MLSDSNQAVSINEIILLEMKKQGINSTQLASMLNICLNSVNHMLKRPSLQTQRLWELSEILQVNFFRILADQLDIPNPVDPQLESLKTENRILKEVITLFGGNNGN